jgi:YYY domain-containing protein
MLSAADLDIQRKGGTWSEIIHRGSWTNRMPVLAWLLFVELGYLAALPLAMFIFRPLPDRGIILARVLGLLVVAYVTWLVVSLGWVTFSRTSILLGFLVLASLSALVLAARWREIKGFLAGHWRLLLIGEGLFLVAFLAFAAIRAANPDLWHPFRGGEKPMELAYLNAVVRSTLMPPYDPWFAGGYLNYYYWGYFVVAVPVKLTGILPTTAFNLAVPLFFALTITSAYSLVYNLAAGAMRSRTGHGSETAPPSPTTGVGARHASPPQDGGAPKADVVRGKVLWSPVGAGLAAGVLTAVIGNLDGAVQLVQGAWHKVVNGQSFPPFDFWRSSRMVPELENFDPSPLAFWVPDQVATALEKSSHITEFPFFTFLFADLHAHLMAIPFALLVIGLGLTLVVAPRQVWARWWWLAAASAMLALALGALWVINSWDYPSYLLLTLALLGLAVLLRPGPALRKLLLLAALGSGVVALSFLAFLPFHQAYETFDTGLEASRWRTPIDRYLAIHGLFLFITATFLFYHTRRTLAQLIGCLSPRRLWSRGRAAEVPRRPWLSWRRVALGLGVLLVVFMAVTGYWTAALLMAFLTLAALAARDVLASDAPERPYTMVALALLGLALAIGIGVELVRLKPDIGRMNTFFKLYLEAWVLYSLAAGYMLWYLGSRGFFRLRGLTWSALGGLGALALLVGVSLIYTVLGTRDRLDDRFQAGPPTLDGTAYMQQAVHREEGRPVQLKWDLEAIRWLQDHAIGSPVVLEAHHEQYHWSARIASYTGLPTILGWPWHQIQQRAAYQQAVRDRAAVVREIYDTPSLSRAEELLRQYQVTYIVVGELERGYYSPGGLEKFDEMVKQGLLKPVFRNQGVRIYQRVQ